MRPTKIFFYQCIKGKMELHFCARIPAIKIDGGNNFGEQINKQPLHNVNPQ